ncbi:hypothetical protein BD309DRAFT_906476, partial [Dichomitus squalens]
PKPLARADTNIFPVLSRPCPPRHPLLAASPAVPPPAAVPAVVPPFLLPRQPRVPPVLPPRSFPTLAHGRLVCYLPPPARPPFPAALSRTFPDPYAARPIAPPFISRPCAHSPRASSSIIAGGGSHQPGRPFPSLVAFSINVRSVDTGIPSNAHRPVQAYADVTTAPGVFVFALLLEQPNIEEREAVPRDSYEAI